MHSVKNSSISECKNINYLKEWWKLYENIRHSMYQNRILANFEKEQNISAIEIHDGQLLGEDSSEQKIQIL